MKRSVSILFLLALILGLHSCNFNRKDIELVEKGKVLFDQQKYAEALPFFSKAIRKNTRNDEAHAYRGFCNYQLENYSAALVDFSNALNRNPKNGTALFGEACIRWELEDYSNAYQEFDLLLQINPNHDKAYFYRGRAYLHFGDTTKALNDFALAMEKDSCFVDTYYVLSSIMTARKEFAKADQYLQIALKCNQTKEENQPTPTLH